MDTIHHLKEEHRTVESILDLLEQIALRIEDERKLVPEHLSQILVFLEVYVEQYHLRKEERLLYAAMEHATTAEHELLAHLLADHASGQALVQTLAAETERCRAGDPRAATRFARHAREYVRLLRLHIESEDEVLYPLTLSLLSPRQQELLLARFHAQDRRAVGPERRDEILARLEAIARSYPRDVRELLAEGHA